MGIKTFTAICLAGMLAAFAFALPARANHVNLSVQIGLPPLVIPGPPGMAVIPNAYVYYPPEVYDNIFFYRGNWYRPHQGGWYRAPHYNGPWDYVVVNHVPRAVLAVPPGYRYGPQSRHIPYGQVKKNWRQWENSHHWDRHRH